MTNRESQSGYNAASNLGLQSYQSPSEIYDAPPETHDLSKSLLSQGAASDPFPWLMIGIDFGTTLVTQRKNRLDGD